MKPLLLQTVYQALREASVQKYDNCVCQLSSHIPQHVGSGPLPVSAIVSFLMQWYTLL